MIFYKNKATARGKSTSTFLGMLDHIFHKNKGFWGQNHISTLVVALRFNGSIINVGVTSRRNEKHKRKPTE